MGEPEIIKCALNEDIKCLSSFIGRYARGRRIGPRREYPYKDLFEALETALREKPDISEEFLIQAFQTLNLTPEVCESIIEFSLYEARNCLTDECYKLNIAALKATVPIIGVNNITHRLISTYVIRGHDDKIFYTLLDLGLDLYKKDKSHPNPYISLIFRMWTFDQIVKLDEKVGIDFTYEYYNPLKEWIRSGEDSDFATTMKEIIYFISRGAQVKYMIPELIRFYHNHDPRPKMKIIHLLQYLGNSLHDNSVLEDQEEYIEELIQEKSYRYLTEPIFENLLYKKMLKYYSVPSLKGITLTTIMINNGDLSTQPSEYVDLELDYPLIDLSEIQMEVQQEKDRLLQQEINRLTNQNR